MQSYFWHETSEAATPETHNTPALKAMESLRIACGSSSRGHLRALIRDY